MKHFVGTGKGNTKDAVSQAIKGLTNPKAIIFFTDYKEIKEVNELVAQKYPDINILGIAGSSFYNGKALDSADQYGDKKENSVRVMAFLDESEVEMGVIRDVNDTPIVSLREFDEKIRKVDPNRENTVCMTFNLGEEEAVVSTLKPILKKYNVPMMGGTVGGFMGKNEEPFFVLNGEVYKNASAYVLVKNKAGKVKIYRQDIYEQDGDEMLTITKVANRISREIKQINGGRPDKLYSEKYHIDISDLKKNLIGYTLKNPLGAVIGSEHYVISMADYLADGTVTTFKKVSEGETIVHMKASNHDKKEKELIEKIKREMSKRTLVFSVDCLFRVIYYNNEKYLDTYLSGMASLADHVGIIGVGEQSQDQHFNQTMICAVFE